MLPSGVMFHVVLCYTVALLHCVVLCYIVSAVMWYSVDVALHYLYLTMFPNLSDLEQWYNVKQEQLSPEIRSLLQRQYKSSLAVAIQELYPTVEWKPWKFDIIPPSYWTDPKHRFVM